MLTCLASIRHTCDVSDDEDDDVTAPILPCHNVLPSDQLNGPSMPLILTVLIHYHIIAYHIISYRTP